MNEPIHYDIIGDIHGRHDKLVKLLALLGYRAENGIHVPPAGHRALFLGDLIDPKPGHAIPGGVRDTLRTIKAMCDAGHALCLMGNHELNAIYFHTRGRHGRWLRVHGSKNIAQHSGTLDEFPDHRNPESEWHTVWMPWMKRLPFFLDLGGIRAVHATWYPELIERVRGLSLEDHDLLMDGADESTPFGEALEVLLRGLSVPLPDGVRFLDHAKVSRNRIRARWWEMPDSQITYQELIFPPDPEIPQVTIPADHLALVPGYPQDAPPVFFGHYLKPADSPLGPECHNVACLDHRGSSHGPLVAYRWKGEASLLPSGYVAVT